ncbi:hypothetical protein GO684_04405 [Wolbachia endosymbiont of Litomosoides brasiliensis]|nr:hypothetical protein [Wolbachia endosymbiont of Litomosoides brasiliensis]
MLKKVRNNTYVTRKLDAAIAAKKHSITAVAKICCISRTANCMDKAPKIWKKKLFASPRRRRRTD